MADKNHADMIMDSALELYGAGRLITREALAAGTHLTLAVIDDRIKHLLDNGLLLRVQRGVFEPAKIFDAPRTIWIATLDCGLRKIDIGDDHSVTLTPAEARTLAKGLAGDFLAFQIQDWHYQSIERMNALSREFSKLQKKKPIPDETQHNLL